MSEVSMNHRKQSRVRWDHDEWVRITTQLKHDRPELDIMNTGNTDDILARVSAIDLVDAAKRALPKNRHRDHLNLTPARSAVRSAIHAMRQRPDLFDDKSAAPTSQPTTLKPIRRIEKRVVWNSNERKRVTARLDDLYPDLLKNGGEGMTTEQFRTAQKVLPEDRRRNPSWMEHERKMFLDAFKEMDHFAFDALKAKIREEFKLTTQADQTPPAEQSQAPMPSPSVPVQVIPPDTSGGRKKVYWTFTEVIQLAREIHRRNPFSQYPYKEFLTGLQVAEVNDAVRTGLPADRRRTVTTMNVLRGQLVEAMKIVRSEIEAEKAKEQQLQAVIVESLEKREEPVQINPHVVDEPFSQPAIDEPVQPVEREQPLPQAHHAHQRREDISKVPPLSEQMAAAATPFFRAMWQACADTVVPKVAETILPKLEDIILNFLTTPSGTGPTHVAQVQQPTDTEEVPVTTAVEMPIVEESPEEHHHHRSDDPTEHQPPAHYAGPEGIGPRRPRIAVIGPSSSFKEHLDHTFPFIDFYYIERGVKEVPTAVQNCDRILGVSNFLNEAVRMAIKRTDEGKQKLTVVNGSMSAVKRQINLWVSSGILDDPTANQKRYANGA